MVSDCIPHNTHQLMRTTTLIMFFVFIILQKGLGAYSFIIFAFVCLVTLIYIWVVIPETKGATFLEISKLFAKRNKVEIVVEDEDCRIHEAESHEKDSVTAF